MSIGTYMYILHLVDRLCAGRKGGTRVSCVSVGEYLIPSSKDELDRLVLSHSTQSSGGLEMVWLDRLGKHQHRLAHRCSLCEFFLHIHIIKLGMGQSWLMGVGQLWQSELLFFGRYT